MDAAIDRLRRMAELANPPVAEATGPDELKAEQPKPKPRLLPTDLEPAIGLRGLLAYLNRKE